MFACVNGDGETVPMDGGVVMVNVSDDAEGVSVSTDLNMALVMLAAPPFATVS